MESIVLSRWVYLVFLDPILRILCFVIGVSLPINTYILLAFILCFVAKLRSGMIFCFLCYCISEILFYPGDGVRQYMLSYAVSIMAVFSFIKVGYRSFSSIDWRAIDVAMVRCFFVIGIGQLVSIAFKGFNMSMAFAQSNVYGALIPHEFAYYNLIFSLYFIHRKKNVLG